MRVTLKILLVRRTNGQGGKWRILINSKITVTPGSIPDKIKLGRKKKRIRLFLSCPCDGLRLLTHGMCMQMRKEIATQKQQQPITPCHLPISGSMIPWPPPPLIIAGAPVASALTWGDATMPPRRGRRRSPAPRQGRSPPGSGGCDTRSGRRSTPALCGTTLIPPWVPSPPSSLIVSLLWSSLWLSRPFGDCSPWFKIDLICY